MIEHSYEGLSYRTIRDGKYSNSKTIYYIIGWIVRCHIMINNSQASSKANITAGVGGGGSANWPSDVPPSPSPIVDRGLRWHDGDGKENINKHNRFTKQNIISAHSSYFLVHFFIISRFMEDINTRLQIFLFLSKLGTGPLNMTAEELAYNLASRKNKYCNEV